MSITLKGVFLIVFYKVLQQKIKEVHWQTNFCFALTGVINVLVARFKMYIKK